jgi:DNA-binding response OmpR family regulator
VATLTLPPAHGTNGANGSPAISTVKRPVESQPQPGKRYCANAVRLLILDDDPTIGRLITSALAGNDFTIDVVSHPELVEAQLKSGEYHVIILDYVIPGLESEKVMEWIRTNQPDASIIVVTGFPSIDSALHCLRNQAYDYITKPFQIEQLQKTVTRCLESKGLLRLSEEALREQLGAAIRERRKSLGLTLAQMAQRTQVSLGYLSQIELGKNSASIETLYRIALGLRVRIADLFLAIQGTM